MEAAPSIEAPARGHGRGLWRPQSEITVRWAPEGVRRLDPESARASH
jgi:hypothetical protein